jgi:hypothetical protein
MMFIAGPRHSRIVAPLILDGPMTGPPFAPMQLCGAGARPAMSSSSTISRRTGSTASAKRSSPRAAPSSTCPYSPDPNPIEQLFATLKAPLARPPRTRHELWPARGCVIAAVSRMRQSRRRRARRYRI